MHSIEVRPADARRRFQAGEIVLLDCREHEELAVAAISGAVHVPMGDIPQHLPHLDPDAEYVIFCHHGIRSLSVAQFLRQRDFERVWSMRGGIDAWSAELDPSIPRY